jgi:hypothetical protein
MTIQVQIELGNHVVHARVPALPREGDFIECAFPTSIGDEPLFLKVQRVHFHQPHNATFDGQGMPRAFPRRHHDGRRSGVRRPTTRPS